MEMTRKEFMLASAAVAVSGCLTCDVPQTRKVGAGMLKGIDPVLSPDLLKALCEMGHGDEILFADAHFPGRTNAKHLFARSYSSSRVMNSIFLS